jgi:hypothetical protein
VNSYYSNSKCQVINVGQNNLMNIHIQNGHNNGIAIDHRLLRLLLHRTA